MEMMVFLPHEKRDNGITMCILSSLSCKNNMICYSKYNHIKDTRPYRQAILNIVSLLLIHPNLLVGAVSNGIFSTL